MIPRDLQRLLDEREIKRGTPGVFGVRLDIRVNAKDDAKPDDLIPTPEEVRRRIRDILLDVTKHDETINWRVTSVDWPD